MAIAFEKFVESAVETNGRGLEGEAQRSAMAALLGVDVSKVAAKISAIKNDKKNPCPAELLEILPEVSRKGKPRTDRAAILAKFGLVKKA